jgi:TonB family protein
MTESTHAQGATRRSVNLTDEAFSLFVGTTLTFALFLTMAHVKHGDAAPPAVVFDDFRAISLPPEPPPPTPEVQPEAEPASANFTGLDVAASESPVRITVNIPILEAPPVPLAPPAAIRNAPALTELRPKLDLAADFQRIFQLSEVDQRPSVLVNTAPFIPQWVRQQAKVLRVVLLMVVDTEGKASGIRILTTSGNAAFDQLIVRCVKDEWVFSPAVRKGRRVKCMVQRSITIRWNSSPFEA